MISEIRSAGFNVSATILPVLERSPSFPLDFDEGVKAGVFVNISRADDQVCSIEMIFVMCTLYPSDCASFHFYFYLFFFILKQ
jgi:hypothetical protein